MNDKSMGVTWGVFWDAYRAENNSIQNALLNTGITIEPEILDKIEKESRKAGEPGSEAFKLQFMAEVDKLAPGQISGQTSYETAIESKKALLRQEIIPGDKMATWEHYWRAYDEAFNSLLPEDIKSQGPRAMSFAANKIACAVLGIDIKNLEDNDRTVFMKSQSPEEYKQNFMTDMAGKIRTEADAKAEQAAKRAFQVAGLTKELAKVNNEMYKDTYDDKTMAMVRSFVEKNSNDSLVKEFGNKYMAVVALFNEIAANAYGDPVAKSQFIANFLQAEDGKGLKAIAAFSVLKDAVDKKYQFLAGKPNPKNDQKIAAQNSDIQKLDSALIIPFQWLFKYESLVSSLRAQGENVTQLVDQFIVIGKAANIHKDDVAKRIEFLGKVESLKIVADAEIDRKLAVLKVELPILSTSNVAVTKNVNELIGLLAQKISHNPNDVEKAKEITENIKVLSDFMAETPAVFTPDVLKKLVEQYKKVREVFAEGKIKEAMDLLVKLYNSIESSEIGGDEVADGFVQLILRSQASKFDSNMASTLYATYGHGDEKTAYVASALGMAVAHVEQEEKLLTRSHDPLVGKYNDAINNVRKFFTKAHIGLIADAIIKDPTLADNFFKRRFGTKLPGRRNFREEFAKHPGLIEKLIETKNPVILQKMAEAHLLETSHLDERMRTRLQRLYDRYGSAPLEMQDMSVGVAQHVYDQAMGLKDYQELLALLRDPKNQEALEKKPELIDDMINKGSEKILEAMLSSNVVKDLEQIHKLSMKLVSFNLDVEDKDYCIDRLQEIEPKSLQEKLMQKFESALKVGLTHDLPDGPQMDRFLDAVTAAVQKGMDYKTYDAILKSFENEPPSIYALFNLKATDFPKGEKGFHVLASEPKAGLKPADEDHGLKH